LPDLDAEQAGAVACDAPVVVVTAGPGTGKTRVLVERVRRAIREGDRPTVVTFTRSAAKEIRGRLGDDARGLGFTGTIHGLAHRILKDAGPEALPGWPARWEVAGPGVEDVLLRMATELGASPRALAREHGLVPYDELFVLAAAWCRKVAATGVERRRLLAVDEAQDLTADEWDLVGTLSERRFLVGDPMQSIFGWRGAAGPSRYQAEVVARGTFYVMNSYRCPEAVMKVAMRTAEAAGVAYAFAVPRGGSHGSASFALAGNARAGTLLAPPVQGATTLAYLARTRAAVADAVAYLGHFGVKTNAPCLDDEVWETDGGVEVQAALRVLVEPRDSLHLAWLLRRCGLGHADLLRLEAARQRRACPLWDVIQDGGLPPEVRPPVQAIRGLVEARIAGDSPLPRLVADMIASTTEPTAPTRVRHGHADALRILRRWYDLAWEGEDGPADFLRWLADPNVSADGLFNDDPVRPPWLGDPNGILCTTIHAAKGREWDHVVLWACDEGVLPSKLDQRTDADIAEARRLFYVATTRAREAVTYVVAGDWQGDQGREGVPSRFLVESVLSHDQER